MARSDAEHFLLELRLNAVVVADPDEVPPVVATDPGDDFLVALARAVGADVIVSGDRHLLELADLQPAVVTRRAFLEILEHHVR